MSSPTRCRILVHSGLSSQSARLYAFTSGFVALILRTDTCQIFMLRQDETEIRRERSDPRFDPTHDLQVRLILEKILGRRRPLRSYAAALASDWEIVGSSCLVSGTATLSYERITRAIVKVAKALTGSARIGVQLQPWFGISPDHLAIASLAALYVGSAFPCPACEGTSPISHGF